MSFIDKIKNWPNKKKRFFSIAAAIFLTIVIVGPWYWLEIAQNKNTEPAHKSDSLSSLNKLFQDISGEFHTASEQFGSTTAFIKSQLASTSALNATTSTEK